MPPDFAFLDYDYEYWVPARFDAAFRDNRDQYFLLGHRPPEARTSTVEQAKAQLDTVMDAHPPRLSRSTRRTPPRPWCR